MKTIKDHYEIINLEYEYSHKCCNRIKSQTSFLEWSGDTCYVNTGAINELYNTIHTSDSHDCHLLRFGGAQERETARIQLEQRLFPIVKHINDQITYFKEGIEQQGYGAGDMGSHYYLAWTKIKALNVLSNGIIHINKLILSDIC